MTRTDIYLNFDGNTEEAFNFYKSVFGGEFAGLMRFKENPQDCNGAKISGDDLEKIMHIALPIGDGTFLMATDNIASMGRKLMAGNNFSISLNAESEPEAHRLFDELSSGGKVEMPLAEQFWGALWGCFVDRFGVQWMVNYEANQVR